MLIFNPFLSGRGKTTHAEVQKFFKPTHDVHNALWTSLEVNHAKNLDMQLLYLIDISPLMFVRFSKNF